MRRKALLLIAVGCLVALAGCSGALSGEDDPTLDDVSYPDGVSENETNVSALADAHTEALNESGFTLSLDVVENSSMGNQSIEMGASVSADRENVRASVSGGDRQTSIYLTDETRYEKQTGGGETDYRVTDRRPDAMKLVPSSYSGAAYVEQFAAGGEANFTPTDVRVVDGTTLVVLRADGSDVSSEDETETVEYDATILVDERGVIHGFDATVESEQGDDVATLSVSMAVSDVNETTVAEPSWLDEARNSSEN